jgi:hypothetical protein
MSRHDIKVPIPLRVEYDHQDATSMCWSDHRKTTKAPLLDQRFPVTDFIDFPERHLMSCDMLDVSWVPDQATNFDHTGAIE